MISALRYDPETKELVASDGAREPAPAGLLMVVPRLDVESDSLRQRLALANAPVRFRDPATGVIYLPVRQIWANITYL